MSKVTQVTVRYGRSVQPKPYESKEGFLEAVVVADEGESDGVTQDEVGIIFRSLISDVHVALGLEEGSVANSADELPKKTRKTRRTKKQMAQDEAEAAAAAASGGSHPDGEEVKSDASSAKVADEVPVEGDVAAETSEVVSEDSLQEVSDADLQGAASRAAGTYGAAVVKGLMKEFGVTLLGKLEQEKRPAFLTKLDELGD